MNTTRMAMVALAIALLDTPALAQSARTTTTTGQTKPSSRAAVPTQNEAGRHARDAKSFERLGASICIGCSK